MPITIGNEPVAAAYAMAVKSGRIKGQQQQAEMNYRYDAMAQQARQAQNYQQAQLQAQREARAANAYMQQQNQQYDLQRMAVGAQLSAQQQDRGFRNQLESQRLSADITADRDERLYDMDQTSTQAAADKAWQLDAVKGLEGQIAAIEKNYAGQQMTDEGKRIYTEMMGKLRAIQSQRNQSQGGLRPSDYAGLLSQWTQEFHDSFGSRAEALIQKPPTPEEQIAANSVTLPDGRIVFIEQRAGGPTFRVEEPPEPKTPIKPVTAVPVAEYYGDPEKGIERYKKDYADTEKAILARRNATAGENMPVAPTRAEVEKEMREAYESHQKFVGGGDATKKSQEQANLEGSVEYLKQLMASIAGQGPVPPVPGPLPAEGLPPVAQVPLTQQIPEGTPPEPVDQLPLQQPPPEGNPMEVIDPAVMDRVAQAKMPPLPVPKPWKPTAGPMRQPTKEEADYLAAMPRDGDFVVIGSPEEYALLPVGTQFIDPNGNKRVKLKDVN